MRSSSIPRTAALTIVCVLAAACSSDETGSQQDGDAGAGGSAQAGAGVRDGGGGTSSGGAGAGHGGGGSGNGGAPQASGGGGSGNGGAGADNAGSPSAGGEAGTGSSNDGCTRLPVTGRAVELTPSDDLVSAVYDAASGDTLLLADGTYLLGGSILQLRTDGVTLRGQSGDREAVIIDGERAQNGEVVSVTASDVTIADLTIANAWAHAIHVQSTDQADVLRTVIHNVHVLDALEQGIKINLNAAETHFPDEGTIACSHIELTASGRTAVRNNCYTGGIDAHGARGWVIRDNLIEGFFCAQGLSEHGVHFWTGSRDTLVERNRIRNCARGIGFGLGESTASSTDAWRTYADSPCGAATPVGHYGGIARNNFVSADAPALFTSEFGFDSGIALEQACGATIVHNTILGTTPPLSSAIEWRFANTSATVQNNLANAAFRDRGSGATATATNNDDTASATDFVDAVSGDLHLAPGVASSLGTALSLASGVCDDDIDVEIRSEPRQVGADQVVP